MSVLILAGPTASGKTRLGAELAGRLGGEIISCDSMQIYRDIPICSAAPSKEERRGIPHHLIGFLPFDARFTVVDYRREALKKIREILARGKQPILVGGTGLYVHSLLYEADFAGGQDEALRRSLEALTDAELYARLLEADRNTKISPSDRKRMLRALEVYALTGKTPQQGESWRKKSSEFAYKLFCISPPREALYERINRRVEEMLEAGKRVREAGLDLWVMVILGLAGPGEASRRHILDTVDMMNEMRPRHLSALSLMLEEGTPLWRDWRAGRFTPVTARESLQEVRLLIEGLDVMPLHFTCDHASNYLPLKGSLPAERENFLAAIDAALAGERGIRPEWSRGV